MVLSGSATGLVCPLVGPELTVGRGEECDFELQGHDVSRAHARFVLVDDTRWQVEDLESRNGTFVNGLPFSGRRTLNAGDQVQIGTSVILVFVLHGDAEDRVLQLQKMDATAQLAGGIVHDLNNMLTVLQGTVEFVEAQLDQPQIERDETRTCLAEAREALTLTNDLMRRLTNIARTTHKQQVLDLRKTIADTVRLCRHAVHSEVTLETSLGEHLPVLGDSDQLHQVMLNLIINARDAIGQRPGVIEVSARVEHHAEANRPPVRVVVEVRDDGCGMDALTRARALEPFFTTKASGKGTGLGLATAASIVARHGGSVELTSALGVGSCVRVVLPAHGFGRGSRTVENPALTALLERPRVLLASAAAARALHEGALREAGFDVTTANDGASAVKLVEQTRPRFHAVIADERLPGLSGSDLLSIVTRLDKRVRGVLLDERDDAPSSATSSSVTASRAREAANLVADLERALGRQS